MAVTSTFKSKGEASDSAHSAPYYPSFTAVPALDLDHEIHPRVRSTFSCSFKGTTADRTHCSAAAVNNAMCSGAADLLTLEE